MLLGDLSALGKPCWRVQKDETRPGMDFVNFNISLNSIASFGSLAPVGLALLFCFSLIRRSLSIVTTWNQQYNINMSLLPLDTVTGNLKANSLPTNNWIKQLVFSLPAPCGQILYQKSSKTVSTLKKWIVSNKLYVLATISFFSEK